jgi:hypothetical protein
MRVAKLRINKVKVTQMVKYLMQHNARYYEEKDGTLGVYLGDFKQVDGVVFDDADDLSELLCSDALPELVCDCKHECGCDKEFMMQRSRL